MASIEGLVVHVEERQGGDVRTWIRLVVSRPASYTAASVFIDDDA